MQRKATFGMFFILLLLGMLALKLQFPIVKADFEIIYIGADGSIEPITAPISSLDNVTYTFTGNINGSLVIERNNIIVDGAGFTIQGIGNGTGITLDGKTNVTIKNTVVRDFGHGIRLHYSSYINISRNVVTNNSGSVEYMSPFPCGILLWGASNNFIYQNNITNHQMAGLYVREIYETKSDENIIAENNFKDVTVYAGIFLDHGPQYNVISRNNFTNCENGVLIWGCAYNNITENNLVDSSRYCIWLHGYSWKNIVSRNNLGNSNVAIAMDVGEDNAITENNIKNNALLMFFQHWPVNNLIYHNNFVDNAQRFASSYSSFNFWDVGYLGGGNYWSDYSGVDLCSGSYQNETGNDGIGDSPLVLDSLNIDRYPLMHQWDPINPVHNIKTGLTYASIQEAINADETSSKDTIFIDSGTYFENVVVNKTLSLVGENVQSTIIDGNGAGDTVFIDGVDETIIDNLSIRNGSTGLNINGSQQAVSGNILYDNTINAIYFVGNNSHISENRIMENGNGITFAQGSYNIVEQNTITNNGDGVNIGEDCEGNSVKWNLLANNTVGIDIIGNTNTIEYNTIRENMVGTEVSGANNIIRYNNFTQNTAQAAIILSYENFWNDNYPAGGNYWSDYAGVDYYHGPYQNEVGSDGIGDTPYIMDSNNMDNYPLMSPWVPPDLAILEVNFSRTIIGYGYVSNVTLNVTIGNQGNKVENSSLTVAINGTVLASDMIMLANLSSTMLTYFWNITNLEKGVYTISINLTPTQHEVDTTDNTFNKNIFITIPGDVTSSTGVPDFKVDMRDIGAICNEFGTVYTPPTKPIPHYLIFIIWTSPWVSPYEGNITINGQTFNFTWVTHEDPLRIDFVAPAEPETEIIIHAIASWGDSARIWALTIDRPMPPNVGDADFVETHNSGDTMTIRTELPIPWNPNMDVNDDGIVNMRDIGIACNNFLKT